MAFVPYKEPRLFMRFEKPVGEAVQGFSVCGDHGFLMFHTGWCAVYDLLRRSERAIGVFKLGSYAGNEPDKRYANHANQAMFGSKYPEPGSPYPYLFVTAGNSGDEDELGYIARCAVERVSVCVTENGSLDFSSKTVHTISYRNQGIENTEWESPCWGWPAFSVDTDGGVLYLFSAKYRTRRGCCDPAENHYIITKFPLPDFPEDGGITVLGPGDITDQFTSDFDVFFTQGGMFHRGLLYHTFGIKTSYPDELRVYDVNEKRCVCSLDMSKSILGVEEIENCSYYRGELICNTDAGFYSVGYDDSYF